MLAAALLSPWPSRALAADVAAMLSLGGDTQQAVVCGWLLAISDYPRP